MKTIKEKPSNSNKRINCGVVMTTTIYYSIFSIVFVQFLSTVSLSDWNKFCCVTSFAIIVCFHHASIPKDSVLVGVLVLRAHWLVNV